MERIIPALMATQHPDNAYAPYWDTNHDGFVSVFEETKECVSAFRDLGIQEFMWDWEGKHADAAVIDRLFTEYHQFFSERHIGRDIFLTFRIPNIWCEKEYSLLRALSVILTSEDFAKDLGLHPNPLFEVILPMTENAKQLIHIQTTFKKFAAFKKEVLNHHNIDNHDYLSVIPLIEGVDNQLNIRQLLLEYIQLHIATFNRPPAYIRPFLAGSDPALVSGLIPKVLANKIALSEIAKVSKETGIPMYPILGVGSLVFRGGLSPERITQFIEAYKGVRTVTIQSGFRYDYPMPDVQAAIAKLTRELPKHDAVSIPDEDILILKEIIRKCQTQYQYTLDGIVGDIEPVFRAFPKRRERKQHIGLLGYGRSMGATPLPRAITFTGSCYSLGIPPEIMGTGQALAMLTAKEFDILQTYYPHLAQDLDAAGRYVNKETISSYLQQNKKWQFVARDIHDIEHMFHTTLGPKTKEECMHKNIASNIFLSLNNPEQIRSLIIETGKLRKSLG